MARTAKATTAAQVFEARVARAAPSMPKPATHKSRKSMRMLSSPPAAWAASGEDESPTALSAPAATSKSTVGIIATK